MAVKVVYRTVHRECDSGNPVIDSLCTDLIMDVSEYVTNTLMNIDECSIDIGDIVCKVEDEDRYRSLLSDVWRLLNDLPSYAEQRFEKLVSRYRVLGRFYDLTADFIHVAMFVAEERVTNYVYRIEIVVDLVDVDDGVAVDVGVWLTVIHLEKPIDFERLLLEMELDHNLYRDMLWLTTNGDEREAKLGIELALAT